MSKQAEEIEQARREHVAAMGTPSEGAAYLKLFGIVQRVKQEKNKTVPL